MVIMHEYQAKMSGQGSLIARLPPPTSEYTTWDACGDIGFIQAQKNKMLLRI